MKNKGIIIVGIFILAALAGFLLWNPNNDTATEQSNQQAAPPADDKTNSKTDLAQNQTPATPATSAKSTNTATSNSSSTPSGEEGIESPDVMVYEIAFNGTAYSPSSLTIKKGDIVVFKNNSDKKFWPASNDHPGHTLYPEFDADRGIEAGGKYEFKFAKAGSWGFHDHLTPSAKGVIKVE